MAQPIGDQRLLAYPVAGVGIIRKRGREQLYRHAYPVECVNRLVDHGNAAVPHRGDENVPTDDRRPHQQ